MKLKDLAYYVSERVNTDLIDRNNYVSTENMLANKNGITHASSIPNVLSVSRFSKNDVLISNIRPYFQKIWFAEKDGGCSNDVLVVRAKENCHPLFLFYLLSDSQFFEYVMSSAKGTKMPRGDKNSIMQYPVPDFSLDEQRRIATILYALDEKIKVNNRINDNLEQQAQALFKSWFIDFEPFQNGEFVDSKLGRIPKGWKICKMQDVFNISIGKTPPRKESQWFSSDKNDVVWISIADMGKSGLFISDSSEYLTRKAVDKFNITIIPSNTVLLSFKLTVGRIAITDGKATTNEAIAHFKTNKNELTSYIYFFLKTFNFKTMGSTSSIATAINSRMIRQMSIIMPSSNVLSNFHQVVNSLLKVIKNNIRENKELIQIRDTLLPKLMSGEISVEEIEI